MEAIKECTGIAEKLNDFFAFVFTTENAGWHIFSLLEIKMKYCQRLQYQQRTHWSRRKILENYQLLKKETVFPGVPKELKNEMVEL